MQRWLRLVLCGVVAVIVATDSATAQLSAVEPIVESTFPQTEDLYLIRLDDPPVAAYRGGIAGLAPTSLDVTGERKLLSESPAVTAYRGFLESRQTEFLDSVASSIGRTPQVANRYSVTNNGMAVRLSPEEAKKVRRLPHVVFMQRDYTRRLHTDAGPAWIGADGIWNGTGTGGLGSSMGEGIVVGVIDTGINPANPSFAAVGPSDGYVHVNPNGIGAFTPGCHCDVTDPTLCNDKLIGLWNFTTDPDPVDNNGHGTHTASTAGGNLLDAPLLGVGTSDTRTISGVARHANIIAYKACVPDGCPGASLAAAIDQAVLDGVDVINYSIGSSSPSDVWNDFDTVAFLNARAAGIFVATSAGNDGPGPRTVGSPADAPWLTTIGASTHPRAYWNFLQNMTGGDAPPPADIAGKGFTGGLGTTPIVHAKNFGDGLCLAPFPAGTFSGEIVVCDRGSLARVAKGLNVLAGGAGGLILANQAWDGESLALDPHVLPAAHIAYSAAQVLEAWLDAGTGHTADLSGATLDVDPLNADIMASFSSRGPNRVLSGIIKPDVGAPGVDVAAGYGAGDPAPPLWSFLSGTSMSSPHVAGAAALLMDLHPSWTPAEIQSALMTTAHSAPLLKEDLLTPTDPFDAGSGRVHLTDAVQVGLLLNETSPNYLAADPATGGVPESLNIASLGNGSCLGSCTWTRVVRSALGTAVNWTASVVDPPGIQLTVSPTAFSLAPGGLQTVTVTAQLRELASLDEWRFGHVVLTPDTGPQVHLPVAIANNNPGGLPATYAVSTSATDPLCKVPYDDGGYLNLQDFGIFPASTLSGDEISWSAFGSGSEFSYYGANYTGWRGTDNGFGFFDPTSLGGVPATPQSLPNPALPNTLQAALWSDLEIVYDSGNNHGVSLAVLGGDTPTAWAIVEWDDPVPAGGGASVGDFEIFFRRTPDDAPGAPDIVYAYDNLGTLPALATIGVENFGGTTGAALLNPGNPSGVLANDFRVCFDVSPDFTGCAAEIVVTDHEVTGPEDFLAMNSIRAGAGFTVLAGGHANLMTNAAGTVAFYGDTAIGGAMTAGNAAGTCIP